MRVLDGREVPAVRHHDRARVRHDGAQPLELRDGKVLVLSFPSQRDVEELKKPASPGQGVGDLLKKAFVDILGLEPALIARVDASAAPVPAPAVEAAPPAAPAPVDEQAPPEDYPPTESTGWAVAAIPYDEPASSEAPEPKVARAAAPHAATPKPADPPAAPAPASATAAEAAPAADHDSARYGEAVVRELLGANFIEEQQVAPRVVPVPREE